jgi:Glycosyl transferase family 2
MSDRVHAIVSVYDTVDLLPHFLSHYAALGVHRLYVLVRSAERGDLYHAARQASAGHPASVYWFAARVFADSNKAGAEQQVLEENGVLPDEYVMHLDLDEFQEYPAPLSVIVREMNAHNDWALRGWIVDRVAEDGRLAPIRRAPSIGEQFPIGCAVSEQVLNA